MAARTSQREGSLTGHDSLPQAAASLLEFVKGHPILDSIADGVFTIDRHGRITSFNRAAEDITGYSREQAIGRPCSAVFRANICERQCALRRTVDTGRRLVNVPARILNSAGTPLDISISTAVLHDREGNHIGGVETFRDMTEVAELRKQIDQRYELVDIVGRHAKIREILEILPEVAASDATVLIQGPSGSGKGLLAKALHDLSSRRDRPFVKLNCAALPETLLESELFGYVKGAFTDAKRDKPGRITLAEKGTLFLDEIGDVSPAVQVKLLRMVQEREYEPLGATRTYKANVRVVAATNRHLSRMMAEGTFREDLYYRLNIVGFILPSLAERREDIPRLVDRFVRKLGAKTGKAVSGVSEEAMALLMQHDYPGNVRELENAIEHALVFCRGACIDERHLPATIRRQARVIEPVALTEGSSLQSAEAEVLRRVLEQCGGCRTKAAETLGLHRTTLWRKLRRAGLA